MKRLLFAWLAPVAMASTVFAAADDWPQFRGPSGDGHSPSKNLPLTWSETEHIKWKAPIHDKGWSSPVILGDQVWVTTATEEGRQLFALCLDRKTGKVIHDLKVFEVPNPPDIRRYNSYASPTPVLEPGRAYLTYGSAGTACVDTKTGKTLWQRTDIECNHYRGAGSSPIIYQNLMIMNFDGSDHQFVIALDKNTGKTAWRTERSIDYKDLGPDGKPQTEGDLRKGFSTPHVAMFGGQPVLLSCGAKAHYGYDPLSGKEYWRVEERTSHSAANRPVVANGIIYFSTGFPKAQFLAVQPPSPPTARPVVIDAADSDATNGALKVVWKITKGIPNKPSPILVDDLIFLINDGGVAMCVEAKNGNVVWTERVEAGKFSSSPLYANGRIYLLSEEGITTVLEAGRQFKILAANKLGDNGCMSSPAAAGNALFLRTKTALYCVED